MLEKISAVTLNTADMARSLDFYRSLGFELLYGGPNRDFSSLRVGDGFVNLALSPGFSLAAPWGRTIFYVSDVDQVHAACLAAGLEPESTPRDAEWGERFFHILDPDGHELSFARPTTR